MGVASPPGGGSLALGGGYPALGRVPWPWGVALGPSPPGPGRCPKTGLFFALFFDHFLAPFLGPFLALFWPFLAPFCGPFLWPFLWPFLPPPPLPPPPQNRWTTPPKLWQVRKIFCKFGKIFFLWQLFCGKFFVPPKTFLGIFFGRNEIFFGGTCRDLPNGPAALPLLSYLTWPFWLK